MEGGGARTPRTAERPHAAHRAAPALSACVASQMQITDDVDDDVSLELVSEVFGDTPPQLSLLAPAKVNLFLRILKKREDGYHELASLFQAVSLFDTLDFWTRPEEEGEPPCSMEVAEGSVNAELIPTDMSNLVMRALAMYAERSGVKQRVHCRLFKAIPAQCARPLEPAPIAPPPARLPRATSPTPPHRPSSQGGARRRLIRCRHRTARGEPSRRVPRLAG